MNDLKFTTAQDYMNSNDLLLGFAIDAGLKAKSESTISPQEEKFAYLIVKECARKLENDGLVELAMELKWHMGLKY